MTAWRSLRGVLGPHYVVVVAGRLLRVHRIPRARLRPWRLRSGTDVTSPDLVGVVPAGIDLSAGVARLPRHLRHLAERRYRRSRSGDTPS